MSRAFNRATTWIVDYPLVAILFLLLVSGVAILGYTSPKVFSEFFVKNAIGESADAALDSDEPQPTVPAVEIASLTGADAIVVAQSDSFFTPAGARAMRNVVSRLMALDYVARIMWIDEVPVINIFGLPEPLLPPADAAPGIFEAAQRKALDHPFVNGQLLSKDGKMMLLLVNFDFFWVMDDSDCTTRLRDTAQAAVAEVPGADIKFMVTGRTPMYLTAIANHEANQVKYQIIAYGMIAVMSIILFRGITAVLIIAMGPALGVFWTLGIIRFFDFQDSPFNDVVLPILISLVAFTDGVHLIVHIRRYRAGGMTPRQAARNGITNVGLACGLTSLTTAIGFGSLSLAHHEIVREFGWSCVIGVIMTFLAVIVVIPLACSSWFGQKVHVGHEKGLIDKNLERISVLINFVLAHRNWVSFAGIGMTILFFAVSMTLRPDERQTNALPISSEAAVALRQMDQSMGGLEIGNVQIDWQKQVPGDSNQILSVIRQVDQLLNREPLIGHPLSLLNLLDALPGDGRDENRMTMLELLPPPLKRAFYTPEFRSATVTFRVQDLGIAKYGPVFTRIKNGLKEIEQEHPEFHFEMSGQAVWRWENLYQIVVDLASSLGTASVIIFVVLAIVYRSAWIGLISVIPNIFPLAVAGTYLAVTGQKLEIVMVCAFTVCLGIAVDDTIHFLTRYQEERKKTADTDLAIQRSLPVWEPH